MYAREVIRCTMATNVYNIKRAAMRAKDLTTWTKDNPEEADVLVNVEKMIQEMENA